MTPSPRATDEAADPIPEGAKVRMGSSRFRFGGNVTTAALSPDGRSMAIGTGSDFVITRLMGDVASNPPPTNPPPDDPNNPPPDGGVLQPPPG